MIKKLYSSTLLGLEGRITEVEADVALGLPGFDIVGLPDTAVKESRERVRAAIKNCGFEFPSRKYTINLAPANIKKEGPAFDLPIALAILGASGQLSGMTDDYIFLGELSLSGEIRPINGVLPAVLSAKEQGFKNFMVPVKNAGEAALVRDVSVYGAGTLYDAVCHIDGRGKIEPTVLDINTLYASDKSYGIDFADVKGQENVKRALEIAAAGGHNCLIMGSPGAGKTMLAQRLPTILPDLSLEEALEVTKIHSIAGILKENRPLVTTRPFRSPHHSISTMGLVGGGAIPRPGELSLAHNGVLFLDELPEFRRDATEVMRQPLEDGVVYLTRVAASYTYPCKTMLVAAMNPCRCGYYGDRSRKCRCSASSVNRYLSRISGPLIDRIDIQTEASSLTYGELRAAPAETSAEIKKRVVRARKIQMERYKGQGIYCNAALAGKNIEKYCVLTNEGREILKNAFETLELSARAHSRVLKVSRTIADLENEERISGLHIAEAIQYRSLDKKFWR